jgi:hypothetical protein
MHIKVKDSRDLVRDENSKALLNTDNEALNQYKARRNREKMLENIAIKYDSLQDEVAELKQLLRTFIEKHKT